MLQVQQRRRYICVFYECRIHDEVLEFEDLACHPERGIRMTILQVWSEHDFPEADAAYASALRRAISAPAAQSLDATLALCLSSPDAVFGCVDWYPYRTASGNQHCGTAKLSGA
jgi:hypothetical protein